MAITKAFFLLTILSLLFHHRPSLFTKFSHHFPGLVSSLFTKGSFCGQNPTMLTLKESKALCKLKCPSDSNTSVWRTLTGIYALTTFQSKLWLTQSIQIYPSVLRSYRIFWKMMTSKYVFLLIMFSSLEQIFPYHCFSFHLADVLY